MSNRAKEYGCWAACLACALILAYVLGLRMNPLQGFVLANCVWAGRMAARYNERRKRQPHGIP